MEKFDGYGINLFKDDDGEWIAHFMELPHISAFNDTPEKALHELEVVWRLLKETYKAEGKKIPIAPKRKDYNGHINLKCNKRLHRYLATEAARAGISLSALCVEKLVKSSTDAPF